MRKILLSLGTLVFIGALVVSATGAFFSDTETSTGNTFAAGDIDLQIDNTSYVTNAAGVLVASPNNTWAISNLTNQLFFSFADVKPGDIGEDTISVHAGSNNAWACMAADITATPENTLVDPESDAGDVGPALGDNGELQNFLNFTFWNDDGDNVYETGETIITELTGPAGTIFNGNWHTIADSTTGTSSAILGGSTRFIGKAWCFGTLTPVVVAQDGVNTSGPLVRGTGFTCDGSGDNNIAQTDGIVIDVSFQAVQTRNNAQFVCSSLPPFEGGEQAARPVGAVLGAYVAPLVCDATVDDSFSSPVAPNFLTIQAAIDDAGTTAGETICVAAGTYPEVVNVNKSVTIAGLGVVGSAVVNGGFIIDADNVTVKGLEVTGGNAEGTFAGFYIKSGVDNLDIVFNDIDGPGLNDVTTSGGSRGVVNVAGVAISDILVENNTIQEWTTGIYTNPDLGAGTPWLIRYNDIDNNLAGIGQLNGAVVGANEFNNSVAAQEAIGVDSAYDGGNVEFNNFLGGTMLNTYGVLPTDVFAENNFWNLTGAVQVGGSLEADFTPETLVIYPHN